MLKTNERALKSIAQLGTAVAILLATSACTHQQLKEEAQLSAIEETSNEAGFENPTPDLMAPATPIPGDDQSSVVAPVRTTSKLHGAKRAVKKTSIKKGARAAHKKHHVVGKRHKRVKTMIAAAAGTIAPTLPPAPPADFDQALIDETPAAPEAPLAPELAMVDQDGGHVWMIGLIVAALGALAVAGVKVRRTRASRSRLVFN